MSETVNWPFKTWLRLAVFQMKLSPEMFWNTDVIDWLILCKKEGKPTLSLADFEALQKQFPDREVADD